VANTRVLRNKIRSIKNTKKITRTMEMIATAKSRVCQKRIEAIQPYGRKLGELLEDLKQARDALGEDVAARFPLLRKPARAGAEAVIVITANRGLCGGYNSNTLKLAERHLDERARTAVKTQVHMCGKKGVSRFKYAHRAVECTYTQFEDKPTFEQAEQLVLPLLDAFMGGQLDGLSIVSTRYWNATRQVPEIRSLLPLGAGETAASGAAKPVNFIFEPSPDYILGSLLPLSLKMQVFQAFVESAACEQIARRIAMKNATDNAEEMSRILTRKYNRARQSQITSEISEIISGAAAVS
jgi:F-type H+-transporting ATPase subunit gamma